MTSNNLAGSLVDRLAFPVCYDMQARLSAASWLLCHWVLAATVTLHFAYSYTFCHSPIPNLEKNYWVTVQTKQYLFWNYQRNWTCRYLPVTFDCSCYLRFITPTII